MVRTLEAVLNGNVAGGEIDETPGNEERRNAARTFFFQRDRGLRDTLDAADARADEDAGAFLIFRLGGLPARIVQRLGRGGDAVKNEVVDLPAFLRFHPLVAVEGTVGAVSERDHMGDLAAQVGDVEGVDLLRAAFAFEQTLPRDFDAATERRYHPQPGDDDATHLFLNPV